MTDRQRRRGRAIVDKAENGRYQWRLKATNGRVVAVSWPVYRDPDEAGRALEALRGDPARLLARISHVKEGAGWMWVVKSEHDTPEARSMRTYERYATCQSAFRKFVALLESES